MITLPYDFDTSSVRRSILKGGGWLALVIGAGIMYSLLIGHIVAVLQLTLVGAVLVWFGRIFFKNSDGSIGTITQDGVVVRAGELYGYRLPGPSGTFALRRFRAVRVEHVAPPGRPGVSGGPHQRVYLRGNPDTPSILIARADSRSQVGQEIASVLKLPCEETHAPY